MSPSGRPRTSAGLLPYRRDSAGDLWVFIAHMGGPLWSRKDARAWSLVKGEYDATNEGAREAAAREWHEETGTPPPAGDWVDLGAVKQSGGKIVTAYAIAAQADLSIVASSEITMEWPPRSGRQLTFPEIDRAEWCTAQVARTRLVAAQAEFIDRLDGLV